MGIDRLKGEISRSIQGKEHKIESLGNGFWFKPKKFSTEGQEEITSCQRELRRVWRNPKVVKAIQRLTSEHDEMPSMVDILNGFTEEELSEMYGSMDDGDRQATSKYLAAVLKHGVGENNFGDDNARVEMDDDVIAVLFEDQMAVDEIVQVIQEHNRPLAETTSLSSGMSQNGSEEEQT